MRTQRKFLAWLMALILSVSMIPTAVLAAELSPDTFGTCGAESNEGGAESVKWELQENEDGTCTLVISGTGAMADYTKQEDQPWFSSTSRITGIVIKEGVTKIGAHAFRQMEEINSGLTIPASLTAIGSCVLYMATFTEFRVSAGNESFSADDNGVLYNADKTTLAAYPIGSGQTSYTAISTLTGISSYAFSHVSGLTIDFSTAENLSVIGQQAFESATNSDAVFKSNQEITVGYEALKGLHSVSMDCPSLKLAPYAFKDTTYIDLSKIDSIDAGYSSWWSNSTTFVKDGLNTNVVAGATRVYVKDDTLATYISKFPIRDRSTKAPDIAVVSGGYFANAGAFDSDELPKLNRTDYTFVRWDEGTEYTIAEISASSTLTAKIYHAKWYCNSDHEFDFENGVTEGDTTTYHCKNCDAVEVITENEDNEETCAHEIWEEKENTATCTELGKKTSVCASCGATKEEDVGALGHSYQEVVTAPTCTEKGYTTHTCSGCHDSYVDTYVSATGHDWDDGVVTKEPTYSETGIRTYTCKNCGETKTEEIAKLTRPSGGSSSGTPSYTVSVDSGRNGSVSVSPKSASKGTTVTITVKPDSGYELDDLAVTDKNGNAVKLTKKSGTKYTFTMPSGKVEVEASFVRTEEEVPQQTFTDVPDGYWAEDAIAWAYEIGYMNGNTAVTFNPEGTVSRQQLWMILARLSGYNPAAMAEAKSWAVDNGISDGTAPGGPVSRQQLVTILYRYAVRMGYQTDRTADLTAYPDHASVAAYAKDAMSWSVANSIVGGTTQGTLNPAGTATRAQFAVILSRFCENIAG